MNIVIVGAGKSGVYLAEKLRAHHSLTLIEPRPDRAEYVAARMPDVRVVRGDGCEPSVLDRANVGHADLVAALTGDDEDNLVVSFLAKTTLKVPLVFARTNHPKNEWLFTKQWGVDVAISTANVIYNLIEKEVSLGDVITLMGLSAENMVIDELTLTADAKAVGKTLAELNLPKAAHIMAIISGGEIVVPRGDTLLGAGDEVLILSAIGEETRLRATFGVHQ
ncbi:MAG: NAD-binding protein [Coriobacteriia bacterium]|nr:NAD-binding protein [Coriobacteriia bacterium]